ncbi:hypothetical protein ACI77O_12840 [Pseudomonas tritici]|uniref:hypothetical protein n=1 Tax=Pseudomonas tritici TaxID=2745518 RepID=UPI00387B411A
MIFLVVAFFIGSILGTIAFQLHSGAKAMFSGPDPRPEHEQPAGRIHLFDGDRYFDSSPENPYQHSLLNWTSGKISCALSNELRDHPEYQAAMIGTIRVFKPAQHKGLVAVIFDAGRVAALGLQPAGLVSGAQMLVDAAIPNPTIRG